MGGAIKFGKQLIVAFSVVQLTWASWASPGPAAEGSSVPVVSLVITQDDNNKEFHVQNGSIIRLELQTAAGTGYSWHLDDSSATLFSSAKRDLDGHPDRDRRGGPVVARWQLTAVKAGSAEIVARLYREWEGKEKAASIFRIKVNIH